MTQDETEPELTKNKTSKSTKKTKTKMNLANSRDIVSLAYTDNQVLGFALYFYTYSTFLGRPGIYLEDLFVREFARGKGIGEALLRRLAKCALEMEGGRLEWAVLDWNKTAISFYKKMGAVPLDEWTTFRMSGEKLKKLAKI